ncbi:hypothetical protein [Chitinophaga oryzae]|uniref:hypothetical protein n=1 Tax=Chitinophaga oryzae TaxID=2725414 RepID=UPI00215CAFDD|nr:hypothetical protein [Chitinophaga oryzae]
MKRSPSKAKEIQVGFLALNKKGQYGAYCLQKGFSYAVLSKDVNNTLIDGKHYF